MYVFAGIWILMGCGSVSSDIPSLSRAASSRSVRMAGQYPLNRHRTRILLQKKVCNHNYRKILRPSLRLPVKFCAGHNYRTDCFGRERSIQLLSVLYPPVRKSSYSFLPKSSCASSRYESDSWSVA